MAYNNVIARGDVSLQGDETIALITEDLENTSAARTLFRQITVGRASQRFPVLSALPVAFWVNGDTGLKQTTELAWKNRFIQIEELAVLVPIPQNVLDDQEFDIWGASRPLIRDAIDRALDSAVFFGDGAPASFPDDVRTAATAAGNVVTAGTSTTAQGGFYGDVDGLFEAVETDGFPVTGIAADTLIRGRFRRARNTTGERADAGRVNSTYTDIDGVPITYPMEGMWPAAGGGAGGVLAFAGDFRRQFVLALRKDVTYELFREGIIQDNTGATIYNLMQQDMQALRVTFRAGWQVANTINYRQPTEAQRYPAAVLETAAVA